MAKEKVQITLVGPLSLAVGRYRFLKNRPVLVEDEKLIAYCRLNPDFSVQAVEEEEAPKKASSAPAKKSEKIEKDEESAPVSKAEESKAEGGDAPVKADEKKADEKKAPEKPAPAPRMARKPQTEKAHETD